jgi:hypothetical protein
MHRELAAASDLLARLLRITSDSVPLFRVRLMTLLAERYRDYWHPSLHSAHRAIASFPGRIDPVLLQSLEFCHIDADSVKRHLRNTELIVWVDPGEVAYRMGERGVVVTVYSENDAWGSQPQAQYSPPQERKKRSSSPPESQFASPFVYSQVAHQQQQQQSALAAHASWKQSWSQAAALSGSLAEGKHRSHLVGGAVDQSLLNTISRTPVFVTAT